MQFTLCAKSLRSPLLKLPLGSKLRGKYFIKRNFGFAQKAAEVTTVEYIKPSGHLNIKEFVEDGARLTMGAHKIWADIVNDGDFVIDATCGKGNDTLWLSKRVGPQGLVVGIDVQEVALELARYNLNENLANGSWPEIHLVQGSHNQEDFWEHYCRNKRLKFVCFNLGFLPGHSHEISTQSDSTLEAIAHAAKRICLGGAVSIMSYVGHKEGVFEHEAVKNYLAQFDTKEWTVLTFSVSNRAKAPVLNLLVKGTSF